MSATFRFIIHDHENIHGAGYTEDAAWDDYDATMVKAGIDPSSMDVECCPCSERFSGAVENQGTGFSWNILDGVAVLREEYNASK